MYSASAAIAKHHESNPLTAAQFRVYVGKQIISHFTDDQLKVSPESVGDLVAADTIFAQSERILGSKVAPTDVDKTQLKNLKESREKLEKKWFTPELDKALDALDKSEHPKAKDWRAWKNKRFSTP